MKLWVLWDLWLYFRLICSVNGKFKDLERSKYNIEEYFKLLRNVKIMISTLMVL